MTAMRHEYHEVTDVQETELEDGRILVAERHRRRSVDLPTLGGRFGKHTGPQAMAAIWVLGGTAALIATIMISGMVHRGIESQMRIRDGLLQGIDGNSFTMNEDDSISFRYRGKLKTVKKTDEGYERVRQYAGERLESAKPGRQLEVHDQAAPKPEPAAKKPEGGTPPRVELPVPENPIHQAP
jgi:hypothetical protein